MKARIINALLTVLQWSVWVVTLIVAVMGLFWIPRALMNGAPMIAYCVGMVAIILALIIHFPPLFKKLRRHWRPLYAGLVVAILVSIGTLSHLSQFYFSTPEGIALSDRMSREAESDRITAQNRKVLAGLDPASGASKDTTSPIPQDIKNCRLAVAMAVRNSLHNPDSFKEVATQTDPDTDEIMITFRGENGFGTTRTETARAQVDTSDCSITTMTTSAD